MKQIFRFAAVAMLTALSSSTALAGNWVVPAPKGQPLLVGDTVYVYNVGQKAWINKGESWGTQAVVNANAGLKYVVKTAMEENSGAVELTDGRYYLWSDCGGSNHYLKRIADKKTGTDYKACFVDGKNNSGNQLQWEIADLGGNVYSIRRPALFEDGESTDGELAWEFVDGEYLGVNLSHDRLWDEKSWGEAGYTEQPNTYALWFDVQMGDDAKWIFVSPKDYAAYANKFALKSALEKAEAEGISDLAAEEAVFNNPEATEEEINKAIMSLNEKVASLVTPENPVDMTDNIVNPDISNGINGWSTTTGAKNNATATNITNEANRNPEGAFEGNFYENWNPTAYTGKMYQKVSNLPNGVYKCSLSAFINVFDRDNATTQSQYVYFNDTKLPLTTGNAKVYSAVIDVTDNSIEMGLAQDVAISEWMGLDKARLLYYGSGLVSYQYITKDLASILDEYEAEGETIGTAYAQAVRDIVAKADASTTKEEALAIYEEAKAAVEALKANVAAYKDLAVLYTQCEEWAYGETMSEVAEIAFEKIPEMQENLELTTEEIVNYIAQVRADVEQEFKNMAQPGDDVTNTLIKNPAFTTYTTDPNNVNADQDLTGWKIEGKTPGAGGTTDLRLCEVYEGDFEIYQDLTNIQKGAYQLEIQAFMRPGSADNAYSNWEAGNKETPAYIYAGDNKTTVKSICDFMIEGEAAPTSSDSWSKVGGTFWIPNTMKTAYEAMDMNPENYNNVVKTLCIDGNMRIGIGAKDENATGSRWLLFHDFKLTYLGYDPDVIAPVLQELIDAAKVTKDNAMAKDEATAIAEAITASEAAIENQDGDAMMTAYRALAKANDEAKVSVQAYVELSDALQNLQDEMVLNEPTASPEASANAEKLASEVETAIAEGTIATADCGAKITEINLAINALKLTEGSDDEPANFTWAVKNPDFAAGKANWTLVNNGTAPGFEHQVMEGYNGNFDVYQDIENLPEGTYLVKCQGFYRYGDAEGAIKAWYADHKTDSTVINGKLYANMDTVALKNIVTTDPIGLSASGSDWVTFVDSVSVTGEKTTYYIPNMRVTAKERFDSEVYPNEVYTYVDASGKLRIGFCNKSTVKWDWTTASYFELFYLGTESIHEGSTGITDINHNETVGNQFYTIDGRRVNGLSKGINIIKTVDANGKTSVRKVIVK